MLRHLGLWEEGVRVHSGTDPPGEPTDKPWLNNLFPDDDMNPVINAVPPHCVKHIPSV